MANKLNFTLELLQIIGNELLGERDSKRILSSTLITAFAIIDKSEKHFHIEEGVLWKIEKWNKHNAQKLRRRELLIKQRQAVFAREDAIESLKLAAMDKMGVDESMAIKVVGEILKNKNNKAALKLGIDLTTLPEIGTFIMEEYEGPDEI